MGKALGANHCEPGFLSDTVSASASQNFSSEAGRRERYVGVLTRTVFDNYSIAPVLLGGLAFSKQAARFLGPHAPFDDPAWIFEPKLDRFRALAYIDGGSARLVSRSGN